ncbi:hypothetical protein CDL15_Pgr009697 [Punica granatum]|uniref:Uncharacterized protein n=1 Tax=Punica granatum TaxID=22663 RepID=A0A218WVQ0_PUNGR|nr:hypothetical protein CDL15_Pgr009697 [Punica granatum]PKI53955.1 hypothetical protein CRG98_025657 [Punica granatum]
MGHVEGSYLTATWGLDLATATAPGDTRLRDSPCREGKRVRGEFRRKYDKRLECDTWRGEYGKPRGLEDRQRRQRL